jgi:hypothetical protein
MFLEFEQALELKEKALLEVANLKLDNMVREILIVQDLESPQVNRYVRLGDLSLSATFGAGQNGTKVVLEGVGSVYSARNYGANVEVFRTGSWIKQVQKKIIEIKKQRIRQDMKDAEEEAKEIQVHFSPV